MSIAIPRASCRVSATMSQLEIKTATLSMTDTKEPSLKGKAQYSQPPCNSKFRATPFHCENIIYLYNKTSYLNEVNCTEPFHPLVFVTDTVIMGVVAPQCLFPFVCFRNEKTATFQSTLDADTINMAMRSE